MIDSSDPFGPTGAGSPLVPDGPAVVVQSVTETPRTPRGRIAVRVAAVALALGLAGGGAALAINAGSSSGGADTPEAAVQQLLDSLSNEDILGAAELVDPSERATLVDSGVSISEQLVRLEVLSPDLDLNALSGVDLRFDNIKLRAVPVRADVTQVFIDGGSSRASVDVSKLPLGKLITDRAPADWLTFSDSVGSPIGSTFPIAVVKRSGHWYVSLWYSVAENARIAAGEPMPSVADRPVPIGADSPEAAVERLIREGLRLDPRTVIGMLDPEEMAALYDYSPLFLPQAEAAANDVLQTAADNGLEWSLDSISLSSTPDGDLASVRLDGFDARLTGPDANGHAVLADGKFAVDATVTTTDYMGDPITTTYGIHDGCIVTESDNPDMGPSFNSCDGSNGPAFLGGGIFGGGILGLPEQVITSANTTDFGVVAHKVDGKWFVSPIRTITTAAITGLESLNPDDLATVVDSITQVFDGTGAYGTSSSSDSFGFGSGSATGGSYPTPTTTFMPTTQGPIGTVVAGDFNLTHEALIPADLPVIFASDMPPGDAAGFLQYMADFAGLDLGQPEIRGGVTAFLPSETDPNGGLTLTVLDLTDESSALMADRINKSGGELLVTNEFGETNLAVLDGNRLIILGGSDANAEILRAVIDSVR